MSAGAPAAAHGFRILALGDVDSTNAEAFRRAAAGEAPPLAVWARSQGAGRGRHGRSWHSPPGNLYVSLLLPPPARAGGAADEAFRAGVSVVEAVREMTGLDARLKWPNDVVVGGRKVAGLLAETSSGAGPGPVVVGTGVNLASHPPDTARPASSLAAEGAPGIDPGALLGCYLARFARWKDEAREGVFGRWRELAHGLGDPLRVRLGTGEVAGRFAGIDGEGALVLEMPDGARRRVTAGEAFPAGGGP